MQEFDLIGDGDGDHYMDNIGDDVLDFDLNIDPHSMPHATAPSHFNDNLNAHSNALRHSHQNSVQPSIEAESNTLPTDPGEQPAGHTAVGAGPLPHSHGVQLASASGTTVTDFTKRRNWSQRVIEEIRDFLFVLSPDGRFLYVSPSCPELTGYESHELVRKLVSDYIHPDDSNVFVREFNESIATGNSLRFFYRFRKKDGTYTIFESHGHPHLATEAMSFGQHAGASFCRGFFMLARPYPTKNAALLDSFLEHKIENERLRKRIADLKREEQEDMETQQHAWLSRQLEHQHSGHSSQSPYPHMQRHDGSSSTSTHTYGSMRPPQRPTFSQQALTQQNLDEALASSRPDSITDKMARYEGATHLETIEMLTGLNYRDGERSKGISTGAASPTLIKGDAGIAIPIDKDGRPAVGTRGYSDGSYEGAGYDKALKKKLKVADEYVCTDCGTLDSPEWRKGPTGPKTLCNACGLRWAKKEKKTRGVPDEKGNGSGNQSAEELVSPGSLPGQDAAVTQPQQQQFEPNMQTHQPLLPAGMPMDTSMSNNEPAPG